MPPRFTENSERPVGLARGTRAWLPADFARLHNLETLLMDRFARAGYSPLRTPVLEPIELHERKSGAGIVSKLFELSDAHQVRLCLRPELTAGIVRAYAEAAEPPIAPWRVSMAGPVFRFEKDPQPGLYREFTQVGVELLGSPGPDAEAEVIWLGLWALSEAGLDEASVRIGHVGLIVEVLERSGLPASARSALVETLSLASAARDAGPGVSDGSLRESLARFEGWLDAAETEAEPATAIEAGPGSDAHVDRLFRQLVPAVTGRRTGHEILGRLRHKWDLARTLHGVIGRLAERLDHLAKLSGPAPTVLARLGPELGEAAPDSIEAIRALVGRLDDYGIRPDTIALDLGFGRGIGFYSQTVFDYRASTPDGLVEVGGGGRYDGLARVLGGRSDDRGVGFALGLERIHELLVARRPGGIEPDRLLVIPGSPEQARHAIRLARALREAGGPVVIDLKSTPDEARRAAVGQAASRLVIVRDEPKRDGSLTIQDLWGEPGERGTTLEELEALVAGPKGGPR